MTRIALAVLLVISMPLASQTSSPQAATNPKVRAITGFVRLDTVNYQTQIADALAVLRKVKAEFESRGYEIESLRLTTQPLAELVAGIREDRALAFLKQLDDLSGRKRVVDAQGWCNLQIFRGVKCILQVI
jgi:uncharacterized protein